MTKYTLADAMGNINDRYIIESALYQKKSKSKGKAWIKVTVATAACAAVLLMTIPIYNFFTQNNISDPFWSIGAYSYEEAVVSFNDPLEDLLIDKLIIDGISASPKEYYSVSIPKGKPNQRSDWDSLFARISYTDNWIELIILFDYKAEWGGEFGYIADFKYGKYEVHTETINGCSVEYIAKEYRDDNDEIITDNEGNSIIERYAAHFTGNGSDEYYMSGNDLDLLLDTIRQMTA